jgi:energy-converting hydrogenase Eha subunit G
MTEQGIGAPGNENENHFRAIEKHEGAAAATVMGVVGIDLAGKLLIPPGVIVSLAASTAPATTSVALMRWIEIPA